MEGKYRIMIGGTIILTIIGAILYQGAQSTVFFFTPNEVVAAPDQYVNRNVRIGGLVVPNSTRWDPDRFRLDFAITEDFRTFIPVVHYGVKPDMYREGQGVVVEGMLDEHGKFQASTLLVKHSEDYSAQNHAGDDKKQLYKSVVR